MLVRSIDGAGTESNLLNSVFSGVGTGQDAYDKIRAGASLVQMYSRLAYEGPYCARKIKADLDALIKVGAHAHQQHFLRALELSIVEPRVVVIRERLPAAAHFGRVSRVLQKDGFTGVAECVGLDAKAAYPQTPQKKGWLW